MPVRQGGKYYTQILLDVNRYKLMEEIAEREGIKTTALIRQFAYEGLKRRASAAEYNAARPWMRRSYVLPEEKGVLWLHYADDREGVLFAFADLSAPAGVSADPVTGGDAVKTLSALHGYRVSGDDLPAAFGIPKAPLPDERIGRVWTDPAPVYPAWTK
jgi:hypothetical protein